jgi:hypothetical protein
VLELLAGRTMFSAALVYRCFEKLGVEAGHPVVGQFHSSVSVCIQA